SMDIVEADGKPLSKRGKMSGAKQVWRCGACGSINVFPWARDPDPCCGGKPVPLLERAIADGDIKIPSRSASEIRKDVMGRIKYLER
ncbi:MAG: nicotinate phosphoribosyltransferase, partial [Chloroflexi bacterium]|nr:nicotinate phosphoribosyltransferase [Chloroflexota bacterium]